MTHTLPYPVYLDRVLAGWIGKSIGGVIGVRFENLKTFREIAVEALWPREIVPNDDLDIQVLWLETLEDRGLFLTARDLAQAWEDRCWYHFCEYGVFLNNFKRGIAPPLSGTWNNRFFAHSEGCPIRAEIWGYVAAGNPALAAEYARLDGQLDHGATSIESEVFLAAANAAAVAGADLETALATGAATLGPESPITRAIAPIRAIAEADPDPRRAWRRVIREYGNRDASKAITNHALVLLALFLGKGDFARTMQLCVQFGWDTDCTAATAGALLATTLGREKLPEEWLRQLGPDLVCGIEVRYKNASLRTLAEATCRIGVEMAAVRNPAIRLEGAPAVPVRPAPAPAKSIGVRYEGEPVLWRSRPSRVTLTVHNPFPVPASGRLVVKGPGGVTCSLQDAPTRIPAGGSATVPVLIARDSANRWLPDTNLFHVLWEEEAIPVARATFGLGGARQWVLYGPYWDHWDRNLNAICPFDNEERTGGPFTVEGHIADSYNQYARLQDSYLDEERLLREEIPEEAPVALEIGPDDLQTADFGGFIGQGCYYLTRTVRSGAGPMKALLQIGRTGPCRVWLDGVEVGACERFQQWTPLDLRFPVELTGEAQRLVIKLVRMHDAVALSLSFGRLEGYDRARGISSQLESMADAIPPDTVQQTAGETGR